MSDQWTPPVAPGLIPKRSLTFAEVLDGAFRLIRFAPGVNFAFPLIVSLLLGLAGGAVVSGVLWWSRDYLFDVYNNETASSGAFAILQAISLVASFGFLSFVQLFAGVACISGRRAFDGTRVTLREAWSFARGRRWALILVTCALVTFYMVMATVFFTPSVLLTANIGALAGIPALLLSGLLWFVTTVFVLIKTAFVGPILVFERLSIGKSVRRSWDLTTRGFWRVLWQLVAGYYLSSQVVQIMIAPLFTVFYVLTLIVALGTQFSYATLTAMVVIAGFLILAATLAASGLMFGYWSALVVIVYFDQRMRLDGYDLVMLRQAEAQLRQRSRNEDEGTQTKDQWLALDGDAT